MNEFHGKLIFRTAPSSRGQGSRRFLVDQGCWIWGNPEGTEAEVRGLGIPGETGYLVLQTQMNCGDVFLITKGKLLCCFGVLDTDQTSTTELSKLRMVIVLLYLISTCLIGNQDC